MLVGYRYLLALTDDQATYAETIGNTCRAVWNTALEQRRAYRRRGAFISYEEQSRQLTEAKRDVDCAWLGDAPAHTLQQVLRDLDRACRKHGTWNVRWKSKVHTPPSYRFPDPERLEVRRLNRRWGEVRLPKFGFVRFRWTRALGGLVRNATVSRDGGRWYISFCVEDGVIAVEPRGGPAVGIDRGVAVAIATSDGELLDRISATASERERLLRLQRRQSRSLRTHGRGRRSRRRDSNRAQLGRLNARFRARRADFAAQSASQLTHRYGLVAVEDLAVKNMTASARGMAAAPGRRVRQKAGLNRAILDKGWGALLRQLEHAGRRRGTAVVKVPPAYTSQTCHACKHVDPKSRDSQAVFRCTACGHRDHADVNAAKNIRERGIELAHAAGLAAAGRGDLGDSRSTKRQPTAPRVRESRVLVPREEANSVEETVRIDLARETDRHE